MTIIAEDEFLHWATGKGMALDLKYPGSKVLDFQPRSEARFWNVPQAVERRPQFIASLIELMGDWQTCYVWRHLGRWPDPNCVNRRRVDNVIELCILKGLGLPLGTAAVVAFDRSELDALITLLFSTTVFGWCVGQDLYVVPDHARQILKTDHHDVIHVSCRDGDDLARWAAEMAKRKFDLPEERPDATFKQPPWRGRGNS